MNSILRNLKPAVNKQFLLILSGGMWVAVGIMLNSFAYHWLMGYEGKYTLIFLLVGVTGAFVIHHFGFLKVVDKNLGRISRMEGKPCVFSFMSWKSYLIVLIMVSMGITLRHSAIPKQYLSILYIAIGLALIFSSIRYFRVLLSQILSK